MSGISLGLDIGTNSVGSAWVDENQGLIDLGVGIFPAGVEQRKDKRGKPVNQNRREKRSQRKTLARKAQRKRELRQLLTGAGLLPKEPEALTELFKVNPWQLRRQAIESTTPLTLYEFGRLLVHLSHRRGAIGVSVNPENNDEGDVKKAIERLQDAIGQNTFGQYMARLMDHRKTSIKGKRAKSVGEPIRNREYRLGADNMLHADREMIRAEFVAIWKRQASLPGKLGTFLKKNKALKAQLDEPQGNDTWRHRGAIFGQRRTYWKAGTLGRCDLEPSDRGCPLADMYAQEYRVIESVNNIRILLFF